MLHSRDLLYLASQVPTGWAPIRGLTVVLLAASVVSVVALRTLTGQLIALALSGALTNLMLIIYHAPDLALTLMLIELISLVLILLVLGVWQKQLPSLVPQGNKDRVIKWTISLAVGSTLALLLAVISSPFAPHTLGNMYLAQAESTGVFSNTVNAILVDFRALDTLGEGTVLFIATLGILGLITHRHVRAKKEVSAP